MATNVAIHQPAQLPQSYEDMTTAIALCESVDECKDWADKAAALASYHRQSKDTVLMNRFMRIQARAIRRAGEVLETIEPATKHNAKKQGTGDQTLLSRTQAAQEAGMSKHQQMTAMKIARIPKEEFEEMVESYEPPTITALSTPHVSNNSGNNEWYTPVEFIDSVRAVLGMIDLDPASSGKANTIVRAKRFYTEQDDGLLQEWSGRVYMNPPYSSALIKSFCIKFLESNITSGIVLVNNATETEWFQLLLAGSDAICLVEGRIKYLDRSLKPANTPLQGQVFLYFGSDVSKFSREFKSHGQVLFRA